MIQPGIHLVDKPAGRTSFSLVRDVIEAVRSEPARKPLKVCHGGTLDPFATGLLLILAGPATRTFDFLHDIPKTYELTIRWGAETHNGDPTGVVTATGDATTLRVDSIQKSLSSFLGWHEQIPPATSARRIDGERAYERAHRGEIFDLKPARVYLHEAEWLEHRLPHASKLRLVVRGGFYVRALVRDLGRKLGCFAHVSELRRTSIASWMIEQAGMNGSCICGRQICPWLESRELGDSELGDVRKGRFIPVGPVNPGELSLPVGFPPPRRIVRAFHRDRLVYFLERVRSDEAQGKPEGLRPVVCFGRGL